MFAHLLLALCASLSLAACALVPTFPGPAGPAWQLVGIVCSAAGVVLNLYGAVRARHDGARAAGYAEGLRDVQAWREDMLAGSDRR